jgi:hypothetical protein
VRPHVVPNGFIYMDGEIGLVDYGIAHTVEKVAVTVQMSICGE